tara:strand:- start:2843 stop:3028 length:186 start_codon:yes stop_codon:yes gene_type:complete
LENTLIKNLSQPLIHLSDSVKAEQLEAKWMEWAQRVKVYPYFMPEPAVKTAEKGSRFRRSM